jgi:hypothetical protein
MTCFPSSNREDEVAVCQECVRKYASHLARRFDWSDWISIASTLNCESGTVSNLG